MSVQTSVHGSGILRELERRNLQIFRLLPLEKEACGSMVDAYIRKRLKYKVTSKELAGTPFMTDITGSTVGSTGSKNIGVRAGTGAGTGTGVGPGVGTGVDDRGREEENEYSKSGSEGREDGFGFLLFQCQITALLDHSQGNTPLFLRLFLRCAHNAALRGFSLWVIWDDWLQATSVSELLSRILGSFERGYHMTQYSVRTDSERTVRAGGLIALQTLYPWHKSLCAALRDDRGGGWERRGKGPFEGGYNRVELGLNEAINSRRSAGGERQGQGQGQGQGERQGQGAEPGSPTESRGSNKEGKVPHLGSMNSMKSVSPSNTGIPVHSPSVLDSLGVFLFIFIDVFIFIIIFILL